MLGSGSHKTSLSLNPLTGLLKNWGSKAVSLLFGSEKQLSLYVTFAAGAPIEPSKGLAATRLSKVKTV